MNIAIFGGTFDPPHNGHIQLATNIISANYADMVLFVPAPNPPHKTDKQISPFQERYNMLKIATANNAHFAVSDIENRRSDELSYSYITMNELKKEFPKDNLKLLIGGDSLKWLYTWKNSKVLVAENEFIIYPRKDEVIDEISIKEFFGNNNATKLISSIKKLPLQDISSTIIRDDIKNDKICQHLNPDVKKYIYTKQLYCTPN